MALVNIVFFMLCASTTLAANIPDWIQQCSLNNLENCGPAVANKVWPKIYYGIPSLKIPSFNPLKLGNATVNEDLIKIHLRNCQLHGLDTIRFYQTNWRDSTLNLIFSLEYLTIMSEFDQYAQVNNAVLPRQGFSNFTLRNVNVNMEIPCRVDNTPDGYIRPILARINIFNRQSTLTYSTFRTGVPYLAYDNSKPMADMLLPLFKTVLYQAFQESAGRIFNQFPINKLFAQQSNFY